MDIEIINIALPVIEAIISVIGIIILWFNKINKPTGLEFSEISEEKNLYKFAQLLFFPIIIFNLINIIENGGLINTYLTDDTSFAAFYFLLALVLYNAVIYWPIHMAIGQKNLFMDKIIGIILICYQIIEVIINMMINQTDIVKIITYYGPYLMINLFAISWLIKPELWFYMLRYKGNKRLFISVLISDTALVILSRYYINIFINIIQNINSFLNILNLELNEVYSVFAYIIPIFTTIIMIIINYITIRKNDNLPIQINNSDVLDFQDKKITYIGSFLGYQLAAYNISVWFFWIIFIIVDLIIISGIILDVLRLITLSIIVPLIISLIIQEIIRTILGIYTYGRKYRPYPRKINETPIRVDFNLFMTHFEYFMIFYSILIGFFGYLKNNLVNFFTLLLFTSTVPNKYTTRNIDIGFKNMNINSENDITNINLV